MRTAVNFCLRVTCMRSLPCLRRFYSDKAFSKTLLLPTTQFPLRTSPTICETPYRERTADALYKWQWEHAKGPLFVLHDGPPYANGSLHMGHALNKILKDIINRYHVLLGHRVHYIPGWDCHGLPIENKALTKLKVTHRSIPVHQIREIARETAEYEISVQKAEFRKLGIMADWDAPERTYRTMDHEYEIRQLRVFQALVRRGLIYRQYRPVYYSPSSASALAEAELVYVDNHASTSVYIAFDVEEETLPEALRGHAEVKLLIWTTTPWTLPTNMGIAVNVEMEYVLVRCEKGVFVVGKELLVSLETVLGEVNVIATVKGSDLTSIQYTGLFRSSPTSLPVLHSNHVTATSGTGLVHCAPAHGVEDYQAFLTQGRLSKTDIQQLLCLVGPDGKYSEQIIHDAEWLDRGVGKRLVGKKILQEGNKEVVEMVKERGSLVKEVGIKHQYPYDWKTNKPVIVTATSQWFADLSHIKGEALEKLKGVTFYPEISRIRLESYVRDRSEWCISRQRPWGVPIPAIYDESTGNAVLSVESLEHIISVIQEKGTEYWWNAPTEEFVAPGVKERHPDAVWKKGTDTMDVWFDSGSSWSLIEKEVGGREGKAIADVCLEGSDQHRGWFQSLLLTCVGMEEKGGTKMPYETVITHGFVLDQEGKKMSKSVGNVISPMSVVDGGKDLKQMPAHGADLLRLWAATIDHGRDTLLGSVILQQTAETLRKIRNSARFILGNLERSGKEGEWAPSREDLSITDRYMMNELYQLERMAKEAYAGYRFPQVVTALDRFVKITLSSFYLDITKDTLYADDIASTRRRCIIWVMKEILQTMKIVMAPILPHLSEEIHDAMMKRKNELSVFTEGWRAVGEEWNDPFIERDMKVLMKIRSKVLELLEKARRDKLVRNALEAGVDIILSNNVSAASEQVDVLFKQESFLPTLFIVSDISILEEGELGTDAPAWSVSETVELEGSEAMINLRVRPAKAEKCPRCWTYTRNADEGMCGRCSEVVG